MTLPEDDQSGRQRSAAVAGMFYQGDESSLRDEVDGYLAAAGQCEAPQEPLGIVVPHAGFAYSGAVAAAAYRSVSDFAPDVVVLLGPCHRRLYEFISVGNYREYLTPLGAVPVDVEAAERLTGMAPELFSFAPSAHSQEHSLEVQLPFLQRIYSNPFQIIPLLFGGALPVAQLKRSAEMLDRLRRADAQRRWLFVCSTDLSHDHRYAEAVEMDRSVADAVATLNPEQLTQLLGSGQAEACGRDGLLVMLYLARLAGRERGVICDLRNSGDIVGDPASRIVGYLSALI